MVRDIDIEIPFDEDEWKVYMAEVHDGGHRTADIFAQCFTLVNNGNWKHLHPSIVFISVSREYIRMGQWQI